LRRGGGQAVAGLAAGLHLPALLLRAGHRPAGPAAPFGPGRLPPRPEARPPDARRRPPRPGGHQAPAHAPVLGGPAAVGLGEALLAPRPGRRPGGPGGAGLASAGQPRPAGPLLALPDPAHPDPRPPVPPAGDGPVPGLRPGP